VADNAAGDKKLKRRERKYRRLSAFRTAVQTRRWMTEMFEGTGLNWSFFDAHDSPQHSSLHYDPKVIKRGFGRTLSEPEIAVYSGHAAVLSEFPRRGSLDYVLVLEEDVIFDTDFPVAQFCAFCAEKDRKHAFVRQALRRGGSARFFFDRSIVKYNTSPAGPRHI
jgi:glycosyl transferase family 25